MGRRRCCCECWHKTDNFDRADSTDLGVLWRELVGDSEIKWNRLYQPNGDEIAIFELAAPKSAIVVEVDLMGEDTSAPVTGSIWRVILQWDDDLSELGTGTGDCSYYYYVDIEKMTSTGTGTGAGGLGVFIYRSDDPNTPLLEEYTADYDWLEADPLHLRICLTSEALVVRLTGDSPEYGDWIHYIKDPEICTTRPKVGLANGGLVPITFDNFEYALHETATDKTDPQCPLCVCWCDQHVLPTQLTLTVEGWDGYWPGPDTGSGGDDCDLPEGYYGCGQNDGLTITLDWHPVEHDWRGSEDTLAEPIKPIIAVFGCLMDVIQACGSYSVTVFGNEEGDPPVYECCNSTLVGDCTHNEAADCDCDPAFSWTSIDISNDGDSSCALCTNCLNDEGTEDCGTDCGGYRLVVTES